jgi:ankyrin repeat protein
MSLLENKNEKLLEGNETIYKIKASRNGQIELVKELLNQNANIEAKDKDRSTPLICGLILNYFFNFNY